VSGQGKVSDVSPAAGREAASLIKKRKFRNEFSYKISGVRKK
jgi:hypothetical protein